jgi:hypothetical protein
MLRGTTPKVLTGMPEGRGLNRRAVDPETQWGSIDPVILRKWWEVNPHDGGSRRWK